MTVKTWAERFGPTLTVGNILSCGLATRLILLTYCLYHDSHIEHIKYTDIDYHVFTNGSKAIMHNKSPFQDTEYRYSPLIALIFVPNILINQHSGKLILILADIICGQLVYLLSVRQGTHRHQSKLALIIWLFNPITLAISTRGSFEPILSLIIVSSVYLLSKNIHILGGILFGLSIHLKLYPIVYSLALYGYMVQRRPILLHENRLKYWLKTFYPNIYQIKFFSSAALALISTCYISFHYYGYEYLEQSFFYHVKRKDLQHNFSVYFYLFKILPQMQDILSKTAFFVQMVGVVIISILYLSIDTNQKIKLRKLTFSLFSVTFYFVSLNKVCTSQYLSWYLIYLPLVIDSLKIEPRQAGNLLLIWLLAQANWLLVAYLYEYQGFDVFNLLGNSSILFLMSNLWILATCCKNFDAAKQRSSIKK